MGDEIAEMFDEAGKELYNETVESLKGVLREQFERSIPELDQGLRDEGGRRWQQKASDFYRPWINEMVETIITQGMNEASGALEDVASSYASEHAVAPGEEGAEEEELLEVPVEETEEVEEVEPEETEPADEEEEEAEGEEDAELEELLAAEFPSRKIMRRKPRRREVRASTSRRRRGPRMGPDRHYDDDVEVSLAPLREIEEDRETQRRREPDPRTPRRRTRRGGGARTRSRHPRKLAGPRSLDIPEIIWEEIEHYIPDGWAENFEPHLEREGNTVIGDEALIQRILGELKYIAEMRSGNEEYPAWENVEVIDAIGEVFRDAGQQPPAWFATVSDRDEPEEPTGWISMEPGEGFGKFEMNPRSRHFRGR
jgi:hypothetical protein